MAIKRINTENLTPHIKAGSTLLVPNLRIKDAIVSQYLELQPHGIAPTPAVIPIDLFIKQQFEFATRMAMPAYNGLQLLSPEEEFLVWNEIINASLDTTPLLNPDETASAVAHSYRLARQWVEPDNLTECLLSNSGIRDIAVFKRWVNEFQAYCNSKSVISLVDATLLLTRQIVVDNLPKPPGKIVLVNFFDPPPLYQKLFSALPDAERIQTISADTDSACRSIAQAECPNLELEVRQCASWAKQVLADSPAAHVGIITSNKDLFRSKLELALKNEFRANDLFADLTQQPLFNTTSSDQRLLDRALVHDAFLILGLGKNQYSSTDVIRLLQSPYICLSHGEIDGADDEENEVRIKLAAYLRQQAQPNISEHELLKLIKDKNSRFHCYSLASQLVNLRTKLRRLKQQATPLQWTHLFKETLIEFGWPGRLIKHEEESLLIQWQELLRVFSATTNIFPLLTYPNALSKLRLLAGKIMLRNSFDPSLAMSFFSINEAIGLEFDKIWMLGMNDQAWPQPVSPSPFLPYSLQKDLDIPGSHSGIQLTTAQIQFQLLLHSCNSEFVASYCRKDGEQEFRGSSFLLNLAARENTDDRVYPFSNKSYSQLNSKKIETIDNENLAVSADEKIEGGASLISNQSNCPFKAFALNRLQVLPEPTTESGISKLARGNALHIALEKFFKSVSSSEKLSALTPEQSSSLIDAAVNEAIKYLSRRYRELLSPRFKSVEKQRLSNHLKQFLELEKSRPAFEIIATEKELYQEFESLRLNIRIDRIDKLQDGGYALIDYKSGKYPAKPRSWSDDRPADMQLPLYFTIASKNEFQPIHALVIGNINAENIGYSGMAASDNFAAEIKPIAAETWTQLNWQQTGASWSDKVSRFVSEFNQGVCDVNPEDIVNTCTYCGLKSLCRIQELSENDLLVERDSDA